MESSNEVGGGYSASKRDLNREALAAGAPGTVGQMGVQAQKGPGVRKRMRTCAGSLNSMASLKDATCSVVSGLHALPWSSPLFLYSAFPKAANCLLFNQKFLLAFCGDEGN